MARLGIPGRGVTDKPEEWVGLRGNGDEGLEGGHSESRIDKRTRLISVVAGGRTNQKILPAVTCERFPICRIQSAVERKTRSAVSGVEAVVVPTDRPIEQKLAAGKIRDHPANRLDVAEAKAL